MRRLLLRSSSLVPILLVAACARTAPAPTSGATPRGADQGLLIEVQNDNRGDFEIFLVRDGSPSRLGVVTSSSFARFEVPRARFSGQGQVALLARSLVGSAQYSSPTVLVNRGERLVLDLSPELRFSQLSVRR